MLFCFSFFRSFLLFVVFVFVVVCVVHVWSVWCFLCVRVVFCLWLSLFGFVVYAVVLLFVGRSFLTNCVCACYRALMLRCLCV